MAEVVFILTTIFVAYVIYVVLEGEKAVKSFSNVALKQESKTTVAQPTAKSVATSAPENTSASAADTLKNPETGEIVKLANNYRFYKRWVKDALVKEGLLDKIYKNAELDDATNAKIEDAIQKLQDMKKYQ